MLRLISQVSDRTLTVLTRVTVRLAPGTVIPTCSVESSVGDFALDFAATTAASTAAAHWQMLRLRSSYGIRFVTEGALTEAASTPRMFPQLLLANNPIIWCHGLPLLLRLRITQFCCGPINKC